MLPLPGKQMLAIAALIVAVLVAGALYLNLSQAQQPSTVDVARSNSGTFDCTLRSLEDPRIDREECVADVEREYGIGTAAPWYEQHPALAAVLAGSVAFFVVAGGGRLFME